MRLLRKPEYVVQLKEARASRLRTMKYVAKPINTVVTMNGVRVEESVMFGIAQSAYNRSITDLN